MRIAHLQINQDLYRAFGWIVDVNGLQELRVRKNG